MSKPRLSPQKENGEFGGADKADEANVQKPGALPADHTIISKGEVAVHKGIAELIKDHEIKTKNININEVIESNKRRAQIAKHRLQDVRQ